VEAQLCGTPVIAPESGAFVETIETKTGLLCHTLADYCHGVQLALEGHFDRRYIRERAQRYDMYEVAKQYDYAFRCLADLRREGWYAPAIIYSLAEQGLPRRTAGL
jgi:glycosyltransferase involved in cell wall biosynthesis